LKYSTYFRIVKEAALEALVSAYQGVLWRKFRSSYNSYQCYFLDSFIPMAQTFFSFKYYLYYCTRMHAKVIVVSCIPQRRGVAAITRCNNNLQLFKLKHYSSIFSSSIFLYLFTLKMCSQLTYRQRVEAHTLRSQADWTHARIAQTLSWPCTTIASALQVPATPRKRSGRPFKLCTPNKKRLIDFITACTKNRSMFYSELGMNFDISERTIQDTLKQKSYHQRIAQEKPFLLATAKEKRLAYAVEHRDWTTTKWRKIFFTDECAMNVGGSGGSQWITYKSGEAFEESCIRPKF
jgi:Transposase